MPKENLIKLREKHPEYNDIPDKELAQRVVEKYPEYSDLLGDIATGSLTPSFEEQKAGAVIAPEKIPGFVKSLLPTKEELPELAGSIGGEIAGGAGGAFFGQPLAGRVIGSGVGAGIGEGVRQLTMEEKDLSPRERFALLRNAALRGSASTVGGKIAEKVFSPFAKAFTGQIAKETASATAAGIRPPVGTMSTSPLVAGMERAAEYVPGAGSLVTKQKEKAVEDLGEFAARIGEDISETESSSIGKLAKKAADNYAETTRVLKDKMYDEFMGKARKIPVETEQIVEKIGDIIKNREGTAEPAGLKQLRNWAQELSGKIVDGIQVPPTVTTFEQLKRLRTNIGERIGKFKDYASTGLEKELEGLYATISDVMDKTVNSVSPELGSALKNVNKFNSERMKVLESKVFQAIQTVNPENIHKVIFTKEAPSLVDMGKKILGEDFNAVAKQWYEDILKKSQTPDGSLSPVKLSKNLNQYEATLKEAFKDNPVLLGTFGQLKDIGNLLSRNRGVSSGSQTAYLGSSVGALAAMAGALISGEPMLAAKELAALGVVGAGVKGMTTDVGREYLTRGFPRVGKAVGRATQAVVEPQLQRLSE